MLVLKLFWNPFGVTHVTHLYVGISDIASKTFIPSHTLPHLVSAMLQHLFTDFSPFNFCMCVTFAALYLCDWVGSATNEEALNEKDKKNKVRFKKLSPF